MKKSSGFISMSIVYSFFLVFITISTLLLANYMHNRLLIKEINDDIRNELSNAGNSKLAKFTNLVQNGDMENTNNWVISDNTSIKYSEKNYVSPNKSIEFSIPSSNRRVSFSQELTSFQSPTERITIKPGHEYYLRIEVFAPWLTAGTSSIIQLRNTKNSKVYPFSITTFGDYRHWTKLSSIITIPETEVEDNNWLFEIIEQDKKGSPIYIDDILLIDLTEALGENLPSLAWLDENIPYFNGIGLFNRTYNEDHLTS